MQTLTMRRSFVVLSAAALLAAPSAFVRAQGAVIVRSGAGGVITATPSLAIHKMLPISDEAVKALIEAYEPGVLTNDAEANVVTIVLDADNNYVRSTARAAKVLQAEPGQVIALRGDSASQFLVRRGIDGHVSSIDGAPISITTFRRAEGLGEPNGIMGTGFQPDEVDALSTKRYTAGALTKNQLIVTVVRLK